MRLETKPFGKTADGIPVALHTLEVEGGLRAQVMDLGATLVRLEVPFGDAGGIEHRTNVVLGFDELADYESPRNAYRGCIVGRCANRIANAAFELDGREHWLTANEGRHHLHGGLRGFDQRVWRAEPRRDGVAFFLASPHGEQGYPGTVDVEVVYTLHERELRLDCRAATDRPTLVNLAHHAYWTLGGAVDEHALELAASAYTPTDAERIPTGAIEPVAGTPFDFTAPTRLCAELDHNFALDSGGGWLAFAARLAHVPSGRALELWTTEPGLQVYTGGGAVCLEAQRFPDAIHHAAFPSAVLRPGETYSQTTVWRFP